MTPFEVGNQCGRRTTATDAVLRVRCRREDLERWKAAAGEEWPAWVIGALNVAAALEEAFPPLEDTERAAFLERGDDPVPLPSGGAS